MKMYKNLTKKRIWLILAVAWMSLIFCFSQQKADDSGLLSESVTYQIVQIVDVVLDLDLTEKERFMYAEQLEHPIRKVAHMTEYAILAWILLGNCMQYPILYKKRYLYAWIFSALYATTDEFHQRFIEGRSGECKDVCIDSLGALLGLFFAWGVLYLWQRYKHRLQKVSDKVL